MKIYSGEREAYLYSIISGDSDFASTAFEYGLYNKLDIISHVAAKYFSEVIDGVPRIENENIFIPEKTIDEIYWSSSFSNTKNELYSAIFSATGVELDTNKKSGFYLALLKTVRYGSLKHQFFENRFYFLPTYDWFVINNHKTTKAVVESLFKEWDKFINIIQSLPNYSDIDYIPINYLNYLAEITGTVLNEDSSIISDQKLRNLISHIIETYKYKGNSYAIELFMQCLGVQTEIKEMYFDRRFYYSDENKYTLENNKNNFDHYLTPNNPQTVSYNFGVGGFGNEINLVAPISENAWKYERDVVKNGIFQMLKQPWNSRSTPFSYFKTNKLYITFKEWEDNNLQEVYIKEKLDIYEALVNKILPIFIIAKFTNVYFKNRNIYDSFELALNDIHQIAQTTEFSDTISLSLNNDILGNQSAKANSILELIFGTVDESDVTFEQEADCLFEYCNYYIPIAIERNEEEVTITFPANKITYIDKDTAEVEYK